MTIVCTPCPKLLRTDYIVMVVRNAAEALDALRECLPDGILPDLAMPIMDGRTVLEARRDKLALAKVPVMISLQNFTTAGGGNRGAGLCCEGF